MPKKGRKREVWIGLVEIRPLPGNDILQGARGAFTNVLALAAGGREYRDIVTREMQKRGFSVEDIGGEEPFRERVANPKLTKDWKDREEEWKERARRVQETGNVVWDTFYRYPHEE